MRKSLLDMELIERWLNGTLSEEAAQQFKLRLLTEPALHEQLVLQQCSYRVIRYLARQNKRSSLENIHSQLMDDPAFSNTIHQIFS